MRTNIKPLFLVLSFFSFIAHANELFNKIEYLGKSTIEASKEKQVLGISSIRYDEERGKFFLVSDDTGTIPNRYGFEAPARYYTINLQEIWSLKNETLVDDFNTKKIAIREQVIKPDNSLAYINNGHVDLESIALFGEDELLVASEQDATYPVSWKFPFFHIPGWSVYSSLLRIDKGGRLTGYFTLPDYYTDDQSFSRFLRHYPRLDKDVYRKGMKRNKGIESLDRFKNTDSYLAIVEGPLIQDEQGWPARFGEPPSRLISFNMKDIKNSGEKSGEIKPDGEYFYPRSPLPKELLENIKDTYPRRGITDIEILNARYAMVIERNFLVYSDGKNPRSVTELYLLQLHHGFDFKGSAGYPLTTDPDKDDNSTLKKKLLLRSTDLEGKDESFNRLNIEGLTLGPNFPDGSRLLIMVNDNDANKGSEPTYLMFFKVPKTLLDGDYVKALSLFNQ